MNPQHGGRSFGYTGKHTGKPMHRVISSSTAYTSSSSAALQHRHLQHFIHCRLLIINSTLPSPHHQQHTYIDLHHQLFIILCSISSSAALPPSQSHWAEDLDSCTPSCTLAHHLIILQSTGRHPHHLLPPPATINRQPSSSTTCSRPSRQHRLDILRLP